MQLSFCFFDLEKEILNDYVLINLNEMLKDNNHTSLLVPVN